jgi:beta-galactosidase
MPKNSHIEWIVNYEPGTLFARGFKNGKEIISDQIETTGEPAVITLTPDRSIIKADGEDLSVIAVQANDSNGRSAPTASNEITFGLEGPGRIIGVGNGDPSSHEPDKYIERVSQVTIENLRAETMHAKETYPETAIDFNDSLWSSAFNEQGEYNIRAKENLRTAVIRGTFTLPELTDETEVTMWPKSLGEEQAIYVNGHRIAKDIKRDDAVRKYKLDRAVAHKGRNIYAVVGTPLVKRFIYDNLNTDPGTVQVFTRAETWKRKVFNGFAQVIVQSTRQPGEITVTATSNGLREAVLKIQTQRAALRPSVPE